MTNRDVRRRRGTHPTRLKTAAQLDALHDAGGDLTAHVDLTQARRAGRVTQRVDFPEELLKAINREARRIGVTRQAYIKLPLADTVAT